MAEGPPIKVEVKPPKVIVSGPITVTVNPPFEVERK